MTSSGALSCPACGPDQPMALVSLHSSQGRPDLLTALHRCPACGLERRLPVETREAGAA